MQFLVQFITPHPISSLSTLKTCFQQTPPPQNQFTSCTSSSVTFQLPLKPIRALNHSSILLDILRRQLHQRPPRQFLPSTLSLTPTFFVNGHVFFGFRFSTFTHESYPITCPYGEIAGFTTGIIVIGSINPPPIRRCPRCPSNPPRVASPCVAPACCGLAYRGTETPASRSCRTSSYRP